MNSRRNFLLRLVASTGTPALLAGRALAQTPAPPVKLEESDPVAKVLGFKLDTTQVDAKKYPRHTNEQKCVDCVTYQGKPGAAMAGCTSFSGKLVPAAGWCTAYVKKPGTAK